MNRVKQSDFYERALDISLKTLNIDPETIYSPKAEMQDGICCLSFKTDFQRYECMLDRKSSELLGINSVPDNSGFFENFRYK